MNIARKIPVYLLLLPFFFMLHNHNAYFGFIPVYEFLSFILIFLLFSSVCYGITYLFTRSLQLSSLITFLILISILFFGVYHDFIKRIIANPALSSYKIVIPLVVLVLGAIIYYFIKHPASIKNFSRYLTLLLIVLCIVEVIHSTIKLPQFIKDNNLIYHEKPICNSYNSCHLPDTSKADIYYLIFDEYTNNTALQQLWQFDNRVITNWLTQKGFFIADKGRSNYDFTMFSISSELNMNYLSKEKGTRGKEYAYILQGIRSMSNNETFCILQKEHYQIRFFAPFQNPFDNIGITQAFSVAPWEMVWAGTLPERFNRDIAWNFNTNNNQQKKTVKPKNEPSKGFKQNFHETDLIIKKIKSTVNPSPNRAPQFVYGHLSITHKPHLYDSLGNLRSFEDEQRNQNLFDTYINQLQQANRVIKDLVEYIMQKNKKNTIIILQGDHGFRQLPENRSAWFHPVFSAVYFPDRNYALLSREMSSVNTFRIIFNQHFCQHLPLLKDSTIFVEHK